MILHLEPDVSFEWSWLRTDRCIREMRGSLAPGFDDFHAVFVMNNMIPLLKHIINFSINSGVFPDKFKIENQVLL